MVENLVCGMEEGDSLEAYSIRVALVREPNAHERPKLDTPLAVFQVFGSFGRFDRECVAVALLDTSHHMNGIHAVHVGSMSQSVVGVPDVFKAAILANANAIIMVHNHPSGNLEPSSDDFEITRRVKAAGEIIGIPLLDHVIVADDRYLSLFQLREL